MQAHVRRLAKFLTARQCRAILGVAGCVIAATVLLAAAPTEWVSRIPWPEPKVVNPGPVDGPPSDAIVLFDGRSLSQWEGGEKWPIRDGYAEAAVGDIRTKQAFGDCQLHVEWATPAEVKGHGQERGNSGVFLMGLYEVQILDSFQNTTYCDGQAAAIYKQRPPLVNACRGPGQWQTYDIVFEAPRFAADGKLQRPAYLTVFQNGVLVQNHFPIQGHTAWDQAPTYTAHPAKLPLGLQYHLNPVRFRNIWIRELPPADDPPPGKTR
ncbi:MAG: DUF1080 domain-containing protein [Thermoguttaceae bacterium]